MNYMGNTFNEMTVGPTACVINLCNINGNCIINIA